MEREVEKAYAAVRKELGDSFESEAEEAAPERVLLERYPRYFKNDGRRIALFVAVCRGEKR